MSNSKITLATIKAFVKRNAENSRLPLYVKNLSSFDGMTDCVQSCDDKGFRLVGPVDFADKNTWGIGVWFVGSSRDYFTAYDQNGFTGYEVYNSCGSFILAVKA